VLAYRAISLSVPLALGAGACIRRRRPLATQPRATSVDACSALWSAARSSALIVRRAENVATAARAAGVERIIYLGGLGNGRGL